MLYDPVPEEDAVLVMSGEAVTTKVNDDVELGELVNSDENEINAVTENTALEVPECNLDKEITDETVLT